MKIVYIGGTGHIGSYLVPRLIKAGHKVINISRSIQNPYLSCETWNEVSHITLDRKVEEKSGTFAKKIKNLHPDIVIDNICFSPNSAQELARALVGDISHLLMTGSIWVHGFSEIVPTSESAVRKPIGEYGSNKNKIEEFLINEFQTNSFPATIIHPGHIVGCGWPCLNPQANFNINVFQKIMDNETLKLPNNGLECVHHVHADDVAQLFQRSIENPSKSIGEAFHAVSPKAITLRGYAEAVYSWFGNPPNIEFTPLLELSQHIGPQDFHQTQEHVMRSPCMSIEKASSILGYQPQYTSLGACFESLKWMISNNWLKNPH